MAVLQALPDDHAQSFLVEHLKRTEDRLNRVLSKLGTGWFRITTAADLGLPADVQRLAGGFTTGCFLQWESDVDMLPVDTAAAIDNSTILVLDRFPNGIDAASFERAKERVSSQTSYAWNFELGNHFIIVGERISDGQPVMVLHSSECEFDYQANGLLPHPDNWYWRDVRTFAEDDGGYVRLLLGGRARRFAALSSSLVSYSQLRHEVIAELLLDGAADIVSCYHKPHFCMPSERSILLGCYLCDPGETVPVFSRHGQDIDLFRCDGGGTNEVTLNSGETRVLVLHGWGRTTSAPIELQVGSGQLLFNGSRYAIRPGVSIAGHPDVVLRDFADQAGPALFELIGEHTPGTVVDGIRQVRSYSAAGFAEHRPDLKRAHA